jgi:hypothetical protein
MNSDSSYGISVGTGLALGMAMKKNAEDETRRKSNEGHDQVLIQLKKGSFDKAVKVITDTYDWKLFDGKFLRNKASYSYGGFAVSFVIFGVLLFVAESILKTGLGLMWEIAILVVISAIVGYVNRDFMVDWLEIDDENGKDGTVLIQVNKYDGYWYRNVDEKDIFRLIEKLREAGLV